MHGRIDLHVHSSISDGTYSPKEIIELAVRNKVEVVALTDHDNIDGNYGAEDVAKKLNVTLLKGIEITASYEAGRRIHILGLGTDINNNYFLESYTRIKKAKDKSISKLLCLIREQGVDIDIDVLRTASKGKYLDRYDIHRYMMKNSICVDAQEVWDKYLDPIPFGEDELPTAGEAIKMIKEAGGLSFIAHYNKSVGLKGYSKEQLEDHIKCLIKLGLDGIERYYPLYNPEDIKEAEYLINKYHLIPCGGTDFHGGNRLGADLGGANIGMSIPYEIYENILEILKLGAKRDV